MRSGKVDFSVSAGNQVKASRILQKMRQEPLPIQERPLREEEEKHPPKLPLPSMAHLPALLNGANTFGTTPSPVLAGNTSNADFIARSKGISLSR
jgi:hypothetical protein